MLIISNNVKLSEKDIATLGNENLIISGVDTAYGTDDISISIEKIYNNEN